VGKDAQSFLDHYNASFVRLRYAAKLAEWESEIRIIPGDDRAAARRCEAMEALAAFTGKLDNIQRARSLLRNRDSLTPIQVRQLEAVLYKAADKPQIDPDFVRERIAAETAQTEKLYGFAYTIDGKEVSTNRVDEILREENDLGKRREAWECSKGVGPVLRSGLIDLIRLRNANVRALGYDDFFSYQVSEYGITAAEMLDLNEKIIAELRPLYAELHTFVRYELAKRYGRPVPDLIPAHWLPNRWGQEWGPIVTVEGLDLDAALEEKSAEWIMRQGERFYVSLGFEPLPESFYELSSLYPLPPNAAYKKNNHASAWHLDLDHDVRSLMSVENNAVWYETVHHELGHVYYYLSYSRPDVPALLRKGADRSYHEAIGSLMGLAAMQKSFLARVGLTPAGRPKSPAAPEPDPMQSLLREALNSVAFMPWASGVMTRFEYELYAEELPPDRWNKRWWELKRRYQGIVPPGAADGTPSPRGERFCDPATKTHINDDAGQYYDYALSYVLLFQLHEHIAREILHEDPHDTCYFGRKDVGRFLKSLLEPGATKDGGELLRDKIGGDFSAQAMARYFEPLRKWLKEKNRGRKETLPEP